MKILFKLNQIFVWLVFKLFLIISRTKRHIEFSDDAIQDNSAYVIAANHRSMLDPFTIGSALSFSVYRKLAPLRFMTYAGFFNKFILRWFLRANGAFPAKAVRGLPYGLDFSIEILRNGGTVFIFPEGTRTKEGNEKPKRGVSVLSSLDNVELIPVHIKWRKKWKIFKTGWITVGRPRNAAGMSPEEIMSLIYSLE